MSHDYDIKVTDPARHHQRLAIAIPTVLALAAGSVAFAAAQPEPAAMTTARARAIIDANPASIFGAHRNPFTIDLRQAPVEAGSAAMIADLVPQVRDHWGGVAAVNSSQYNAAPQLAEPDDPKVRVVFHDCQGKGYTPQGLYDGEKMFLDVPMPKNLRVTNGTDKATTIYQPSTDKMWEFWVVEDIDNAGRTGFSACWGGRIEDVSKGGAQHIKFFGSSASGLAQLGSMISLEEAKAGKINHTIGLGIMRTRAGTHWWPAVRNDGNTPGENIIPEGARLRLKPDADVTRLSPFAKTVAEAAKTYGFTVVDTSGAVAITAEDAPTADGKGSRWDTEVFHGTPGYQQLKDFPWDQLEVIQAEYGKDGQGAPAPSTTEAPRPTGTMTTQVTDPTASATAGESGAGPTPAPSQPAVTVPVGEASTEAPACDRIQTQSPSTPVPVPTGEATGEPVPEPSGESASPAPTVTATAPIAVGEPPPGVPVDDQKSTSLTLQCVLKPASGGQANRLECTFADKRASNIVITFPTVPVAPTQTAPVEPRT